jgi:exosome complex component RRP42
VTVCKVGDKFLIDPILEEENVIESKLSVAVRDDGKVCALQKQGSKELEIGDVERMIEVAIEKSEEIRKLVG